MLMTSVQYAKHREQAVLASMMSFVLLKNENRTLPLWSGRKYAKVAVGGATVFPLTSLVLNGERGPVVISP